MIGASEACRGRALLLVIEGGEEADGHEGRAAIPELLEVLSPENRVLLLTRSSTQFAPAESVFLREALDEDDAAALFDSLTAGVSIAAVVRAEALCVARWPSAGVELGGQHAVAGPRGPCRSGAFLARRGTALFERPDPFRPAR